MTVEQDRGALAFGEKLLTILGEGSFTATYKYAVILALLDLSLEHSDRTGAAPTSVTTVQLAEKVLELYWPHTMPYRHGSVLRQNSGRKARILADIERFRETHAPDPSLTLRKARLQAHDEYAALVQRIEWTLVKMPLPKLQRLGNEVDSFLYRITWADDISKSQFSDSDFDNLVRFVGSSSEHLVRLAGLIRPLVKRQWTSRVARFNSEFDEALDLEEFLFGSDRTSLTPVRSGLRELQDNRCFYCGHEMTGSIDVDHFIPWSRYPNNCIENLVLAHSRCNRAKLDHLADAKHVSRWMERSLEQRCDLETIARDRSWDSDSERSESVARSIYLRLPDEVRLWRKDTEFVPMDRSALLVAFRI